MPVSTVATSVKEKQVIQNAYKRLLRSIKNKLNVEDRDNIKKAYELAVDAHQMQRRKSGEPYVLHPLEVARICTAELGLGPTAIICAILHDVVEDTEVTHDEIHEMFGTKISRIVDGLTKLDGLYNVESPQAENFKKVLSTLIEDVRVVLIKMADRLHNLRTIDPMPRHKQLKIAAETSYIYSPLAHRLGLYKVKTEFQDICMKITEPDTYNEILIKLKETERKRDRYIKEFINPIKSQMNQLKIPFRITGRPKSLSSIWTKIKKKKVPFEEIYDLFAVRIILEVAPPLEKNACWQVYSLITDFYKPIPERLKDWVTTPKGNGYESLHTTVIGPKGRFVEVQIRTERMDEIAERGFAAHWKYKGIKGQDNVYDSWLDGIRDILETPHSDAIEFINDFKSNLFSEEVYSFTPNGDMKILPKGATALDFAFAIHSDIGYHATAIKVNNKLVPMGYKLKNGDQVHVTTMKNQRPTEDWLKIVVTGKARSKIRSSMKEEKRKKGEFGQEALQRKLKNMKLDYDLSVDFLVAHFGLNSRPDLYYDIAMEKINIQTVLKQFDIEAGKLVKRKPELHVEVDLEPKKEIKPKKIKQEGLPEIVINGEIADNINYTLSGCCNPLQGDDIFAYMSTNAGMKIHRINCPNATHLMANYGYRVMKAEWAKTSTSNFVVDLIITGIDSGPGVIQKITNEISSTLGLNIRSFSIEGKEGYFEGKVGLFVLNKDQLNRVVIAIKNIDGVSSVTRSAKTSFK
jgi:GTP pyrophosphokinase